MELKKIYSPVRNELDKVDEILRGAFRGAGNTSIRKIVDYLLESPGKRIRPALVILSAKAASGRRASAAKDRLIRIASAIELIHMAALIHDDVIDHCDLRHHKPTVNSRWGQDVSIILGDYLYSLAFKLISSTSERSILDCISSATKELCEGELTQVAERDNLSLSKERYIVIVKKKTASLFAASCRVGAMASDSPRSLQDALNAYGLNFGIAFQIIDDYLDIMASQEELGKPAGLDVRAGELTLPLLFFANHNRESFRGIFLKAQNDKDSMKSLRRLLASSRATEETKKVISGYVMKAKASLGVCRPSEYKEGLIALVDFIQKRVV